MKLPIEESIPENALTIDKAYIHAKNLGRQHGAAKAEWFAQDSFGGRCTKGNKEKAKYVLDIIENDGIFELDVTLPNVSGEYSDDLTPHVLLGIVIDEIGYCTGSDLEKISHLLPEICSEYEYGAAEGFTWRLTQLAKLELE